MRFPYFAKRLRSPTHSRPGVNVVHLPMLAITPAGMYPVDGLVDSAATDVVLPLHVAAALSLDLTSAPAGKATLADGSVVTHRYAHIELYLSDGYEAYQWPAVVAFLDVPGRRHALLGHAGFLDFFDVLLKAGAKETIVDPNAAFPGRQVRP
jgi:hypothetical protein